MMNKNLAFASFFGFLAVLIGAFGAHYFKEKLSVEQFGSYKTAVEYLFYHVLVLLFVNSSTVLSQKQKNNLTKLFVIGILSFSGSIFAITIVKIPAKLIWFVTPFGGLLLMAGWLYMFLLFLKKK